MPTVFTFKRTQTVSVRMADAGENDDESGECCRWATPEAQRESAKDWANQTFVDDGPYPEHFVKVEETDWEEIDNGGDGT